MDWNGAFSPCVFLPYSPINIKEVYASGGNLNDVWAAPFFQSLRQWQVDFRHKRRNDLSPCPNRDHHEELQRMLLEHEPDPTDANAAAALLDPEYSRGLAEYGAAYEALTKRIWENFYLHRALGKKISPEPLPDITAAGWQLIHPE